MLSEYCTHDKNIFSISIDSPRPDPSWRMTLTCSIDQGSAYETPKVD